MSRRAVDRRPSRWPSLAALLCTVLALGGCERMFRDMYDQPKLKPATSTPLFRDGLASRPPPPGSLPVALGEAAANASGRRGRDRVAALEAADARQALPNRVDVASLERGHERYTIYCAPCHGSTGGADGPVVQRGFPAPPSYRLARLRGAPDRHFFDVMSQGYGVMYSYADRVDSVDRWAIVAWIRHLQHDSDATLAAAVASDTRSTPFAAAAAASGTSSASSASSAGSATP